MLGAELTEHLCYEHGTEAPPVQANRRNGVSRKTLKGDGGAFELEVPRDRDGSFEPRLVGKGQTRIEGIDESEADQETIQGIVSPPNHRDVRAGHVGAGYPRAPRGALWVGSLA